jgi:hypothetical protein
MSIRLIAATVAIALVPGTPVTAQEIATDDGAVAWRQAFKTTAMFWRAPDEAAAGADRNAGVGFWRIRTDASIGRTRPIAFELAVEQRVYASTSSGAPVAGGILPARAPAPFRIRQLDWQLAAGPQAAWHVEIDRAAVQVRMAKTTVTAGRQAVGWGRGVVFNAIDIFAPFTPLEVDREWRRGIDAVRAEVKVSDRTSIDAVAAIGTAVDGSAFAARVRGYGARADVEVVAGRRGPDGFAGFSASAPVGDAEVHGEMAIVRVVDRTAINGVAGGSYQFALGNGLLAFFEYHYTGLGGELQTTAKHYAAVVTSYEWSPELTVGAEWLHAFSERSGTLVPSATITFNDRWSLLVSGYAAYGNAPLALLAQLRVYR